MFCNGSSFYSKFIQRLAVDPVGALHMLRVHKLRHVEEIDRTLARSGFVLQVVEPMKKEERN